MAWEIFFIEGMMFKRIPIGVDDFSEMINKNKNFLFVDKSLLIKELLEKGSKVSLMIRPRRWGKTLNMSMLQYFFSPKVHGISTKGIFNDLKIAKENNGYYIEKYQGKYPVIFITFKDVKENSYEDFINAIYFLVQNVCNHFTELNISTKLTGIDRNNFNKLSGLDNSNKANQLELRNALHTLSSLLFKHYNQKVFILIDEYDTPLNHAHGKAHFEQMVDFFKGMLGVALKGNAALEKGILTGILRLSKNKMLSDINNLALYSLMEKQYSGYFGFSEEEVMELCQTSNMTLNIQQIKHWYNGYHCGALKAIYNPWSILNCIQNDGELKPYWIKTGNESLLKEIFSKAPKTIENKLVQLLEGGAIEATIDEYISFDQIDNGNEDVLWSLLWTTGYLKFSDTPILTEIGNYRGFLEIPNYEVSCNFRLGFPKWIRAFNRTQYDSFLHALIVGKVEDFTQSLKDYMLSIPSWFDFPSESNYHTFLLGLTASLTETHEVVSNQEVGLGRVDFLLTPKDVDNDLGIIIELKRDESQKDLKQYELLACKGLQQIKDKKYSATLKLNINIHRILNLCIVFYGKEFVYKYSFEELCVSSYVTGCQPSLA